MKFLWLPLLGAREPQTFSPGSDIFDMLEPLVSSKSGVRPLRFLSTPPVPGAAINTQLQSEAQPRATRSGTCAQGRSIPT